MDRDQIIEEQLKALPKPIRDQLATGAWANNTEAIAKQYYLDTEQTDKLKNEVILTLIGLEDTRDLNKNISENVGVNTDLAQEITNSVSREILGPLVDIWEEIEATAPKPVDPLVQAESKFTKIAESRRFKKEEMLARFKTLPKNVQSLITGNDIAQVITPLAQKYDLHIDQGGVLAELATLVMLGLIKTTDFIKEIENSLGLTKVKSGDIAYEIDQTLFKPIREDLKKAAHTEPTKAPTAQPANQTPNHTEDIIHPHPAQTNYYGSVPASAFSPKTEPSKITEQKLNSIVTSPKKDVTVQRTIDPYREPID